MNLGKCRSSNDLTQRQGNGTSRFGFVLSSATIVINPSHFPTIRFFSSTTSLASDAGNTLLRRLHSSTCTCCRWCMLRIPWGSSFQTFSRFGSFHKVKFFRGKVINVSSVVHLTSKMALTESQFRTSNVLKLVKKGSKLSGRSTSDKKWQPSIVRECKRPKQEFGMGRDPRHSSCISLSLKFDILSCKTNYTYNFVFIITSKFV